MVAVFFLLWVGLTFTGIWSRAIVSGQGSPRRQLKEVHQRVRESIRRRVAGERRPAGREGVALDSPAEWPVRVAEEVAQSGGDRLRGGERARRRYDQPREAIEFFLFKRLAEGEKDLSFDRYLTARRQAEELPRFSSALGREVAPGGGLEGEVPAGLQQRQSEAAGIWSPLGPGNIGGRTRSILINPQNPAIMYAAGVSGGVWRSVDGGGTWTPLTDLLPGLTVSSMAFEPGNPLVIYIGTGEGVAAFERDTQGDFRGAGIFKSTDGGDHWTRLESTGGADFYFVNDLIVSRTDVRRLYAATRTGVWRSLDGGTSWARLLNPLNGTGQTVTGGCLDLAERTDQPRDSLFAACGTFDQATVYRNANASGDGTWESVLTEPDMGRTALAVSPSDQNIIYAVASSIEAGPFESALHAVFRSSAGGEAGSWVARVRNTDESNMNRSLLSIPTLALATECGFGGTNDFFGQGWYDLSIAVDPLDSNRVWVGGIDLFRSDDGGVNWGVAGPSYVGASFAAGPIHPDHHVIIFHPKYDGGANQQLFIGNDGGVYRTLNARGPVATTPAAACRPDGVGVQWQSLNTNYGVTQFYHGSVAPDGRSYYGGTQDNGTIFGTDSGGINQWREIYGGDGGYTAFDFTDPLNLFASFTYISLAKSTDGGRTFGEATRGIDDRGLFIAPYVMDPSDPQRLWTGGDYIWRTVNGASNWERASSVTPGTLQVSALAISPVDANRMLVGMADGYVLRHESALQADGTSSWLNTRPRSGYISSLTFDPVAPEIAYATYSTFTGKHVWRTIDGGVSWSSIDGTGPGALPDIPVHTLVVDPFNQARLYVGTDLGVFVTNNGGTTWAVEFSGFANVITESLQLSIQESGTWLYAFTHGRGVWRVRISDSACQYSLFPATITLSGAGETPRRGRVEVRPATVGTGCGWEARSRPTSAGWLTVNGQGTGAGQVEWSVAENTSTASRIGTATIAGRTLTIIQPGRPDTVAPVVVVTTSTVPFGGSVTSGTLELAGTVSDNDLLAGIRWVSDRGPSGQASLALNGVDWRIPVVPLAPGLNRITITATDRSGNGGLATWEVTASPPAVVMTVAGTGDNGRTGDGGAATEARLSRPTRLAFDRSGNLYFADSDNNVVRRIAPDGVITLVAGTGAAGFSGDGGAARQATLNFPIGVAVDSAGNLYICDNGNARLRKVVMPTGVITTIAGNGVSASGPDGGLALDTSLNNAQAIDLDGAGNVYIAELGSHRIRRLTVADGKIETIAGTGAAGFSGDGAPAKGAALSSPNHVSVDSQGNVVISDAGNNRIRQVTAGDGLIRTLAGNGQRGFSGDGGPATSAALSTPASAIYDSAGNLLIADRGNQRLRRVAAGTGIISTIAGTGEAAFNGDGLAATATALNFPTGLAVDPAGVLYVGDRDNRRLRRLALADGDAAPPVIAIVSPTALPTLNVTSGNLRLTGTASDNRQLLAIRWFNDRGGMGAATGLTSWRVDQLPLQPGLNQIRVTAWDVSGNTTSVRLAVNLELAQTIRTLAGNGRRGDQGDGQLATLAGLFEPSALVIDRVGNILVADSGNNRVRRIAPNGVVTAYAGNGTLGSRGDGGPASAASLNGPHGLALDSKGNLYIADTFNHRIRRVTPAGLISTVAGNGQDGMLGDDGPAVDASLYLPFGVAIDGADNLIIADTGNLRLRRVDLSTGRITTIAGNGRFGTTGDGLPAREASFMSPYGVTVDSLGTIYVADGEDHRVRRIDQQGIITAWAGTGVRGGIGDGRPALEAQLNSPSFLSTDPDGNLYIADYGNHRIRRVGVADGLITTVVGTGSGGPGMDGVDPRSTSLLNPNDVAIDPLGRLVLVDSGNHRLRRVVPVSSLTPAVLTSAASYNGQQVARDALVTIFGQGLATTSIAATALPLPTQLGGTSVMVRDAAGIERPASLLYVSPQQINLHMPASTAPGTASVTIASADGRLATALIPVANTAPAIFTAGADGRGAPAAYLLRVKTDGRQLYEPVARYDSTTSRWVPVPIESAATGEQLYLVLFGSGWRFAGPLGRATVLVGGAPAEVAYLGPQGDFVGLDQLNLRLDPGLAGRGLVDIQVLVDGVPSNLVQLLVR
jgi:uncharacterized protein (TIGR03437 family)